MSTSHFIERTKVTLSELVLPAEVALPLEAFLQEYQFKEELLKYQLAVNNKLLLFGATGCGKTMTAKAIATHFNKKLIVVNLAAIVSSKLGETTKNLEELFKEVQYESAVLFLDEFDSLGQLRSFDAKDNSEMKRVVNALLQLIDYFPTKSILIAATNQVDLIDPALRRRFEVHLEYRNPNEAELDGFYNQLLAKYPLEYQQLERKYQCSYATAAQHCYTGVKKNIIQQKLRENENLTIFK